VHLNIKIVRSLLSRHPDVIPFLVHIGSEAKHVERMAVRAKYMTLDPHMNRSGEVQGTVLLLLLLLLASGSVTHGCLFEVSAGGLESL